MSLFFAVVITFVQNDTFFDLTFFSMKLVQREQKIAGLIELWVHTFLSIIPRHPWFKNYLKQKWQLLSKTWVLPKVIATVEKLYFERKKSFTAVLKCILQEHCNVILWLTLLFCWQLLFSVAVFHNCKYQCVMYSDLMVIVQQINPLHRLFLG